MVSKLKSLSMKKALFLFVACLISAIAASQTTDFSGKWKLNTEKSKLGTEFSLAPSDIIVIQTGNDLSIEKHSNFQGQEVVTNDKFTLDGKECVNTGFQDSQKKSVTSWSEDKKILTITTKMSIGDAGDISIIEVYKIDGDNLLIESSASSSYGDLAETMVYSKA